MRPVMRGDYDAFISYAWPDKDLVGRLVEELESRQLRVWFDGRSAPAGEDLGRLLSEALDRARACIVVLSPASDPTRSFISKEWSAIQEASWRRDDLKICAVRIGDVELPPFLRKWQSVSLAQAPLDLGQVADQLVAIIRDSSMRPSQGVLEQERSRAAARMADLQRTLLELRTEGRPASRHEQGR